MNTSASTFVMLICAMFLALGLDRLLKTNQYYCKLMGNLYERRGVLIVFAVILFIGSLYWVNKSDKADAAGVQSGSADSAVAGFGQTAPETNRQAGDRANPIVSQNESRQAFLHERGRQN